MEQIVIGIGGEKEVGKDTSARILIEKHGFQRFAFADPLKEVVAEAFQLSIYDLHDPIKKETKFFRPFILLQDDIERLCTTLAIVYPAAMKDVDIGKLKFKFTGEVFDTPRQLLQFIGTDFVRGQIKDSFWVDVFHNQIKPVPRVIITDMRFPNEREFVSNTLKGRMLLIKRNKNKPKGTHASENSLGSEKEYDAVIENTGSVEELTAEVERFYQCTKAKQRYTQKEKFGILSRLLTFLKIT